MNNKVLQLFMSSVCDVLLQTITYWRFIGIFFNKERGKHDTVRMSSMFVVTLILPFPISVIP